MRNRKGLLSGALNHLEVVMDVMVFIIVLCLFLVVAGTM